MGQSHAIELEVLEILMESEDHREFLQKSFQFLKASKKVFSYESFALRAGIASRNYVRDVVVGKKRLTAQACYKFARGFGLKTPYLQHFVLLASLEEPGLNPQRLTADAIKKRIQKSKARLKALRSDTGQGMNFEEIFRFSEWPIVYAALGDQNSGATLKQISMRTGLDFKTCDQILRDMILYKMVSQRPAPHSKTEATYVAQNMHVILNHQKKNSAFQIFFLRGLERASKTARGHFESKDAAFLSSVFSVSRSRLPLLKEALRALAQSFAEEAEENSGDTIASLTISLVPTSISSF